MKTLRKKIIAMIVLLLSISMIALGGVSIWLNYSSTINTVKTSMQQIVGVAAERFSWELTAYRNVVEELGLEAILSKYDATEHERQTTVNKWAERYNFVAGHFIGLNGISETDKVDYSDAEYVKAAMRGETYVSSPIVSSEDNSLALVIAAPVWQSGLKNSRVAGVVIAVMDGDAISKIAEGIRVSASGSAYVLNKAGETIAHRDRTLVSTKSNTQNDVKTDPRLEQLAEIERNMMSGMSGLGEYQFGGVEKFLAYAPIPSTNGWSIAITAPKSDFLADTMQGIYILTALVAVALIGGILAAMRIASGIANPIRACAKRISLLAEGDLKSPVPNVKSKDETRLLAQSTGIIVESVNKIIADVDYCLGQMAKSNFSVSSQSEESYRGDFHSILLSIHNINARLSDTIRRILQAAEQVATGSAHVAAGAQTLSQGAAEQAATVEELSASVATISAQVNKTTENAGEAYALTGRAQEEISTSNAKMADMVAAMEEISGSSNEIGKIIKTIEDIAFQTNILALNAAVEAARAGAAGKGFAVVADEVRNLAGKSAAAAKNTTALIENSIAAVDKGARIAEDTAHSLNGVVGHVKNVSGTVDRISAASREQAEASRQVAEGMHQISAVVQNNSATAEQSAAASEELSGQATLLKSLVSSFTLREAD